VRSIVFAPQAEVDLLEIWHHIASTSPSAARMVDAEIDRAIRGLAEMPGKGHYRADVDDPRCRCWTVYSYVIIYRYDDSTLTVVKVVHGARDFGRLFP